MYQTLYFYEGVVAYVVPLPLLTALSVMDSISTRDNTLCEP